MDLSKLTYTKGVSGRVPREPVKSTDVKTSRKTIVTPAVSPSYQKTDGVLSPNLIFVLSGGSRRERDFLKVLIKQVELRSLRVAFLSKENQGYQPYQMQERWQDIRTSGEFTIDGQLYHLDAMDKVFLLTDVDDFYDQLQMILSSKSADDIGCWIISNPCIEIWLYYCFKNDPMTDFASVEPLRVDKRSQEMKRLGNVVVAGGLNPILAFDHLHDGIVYSQEHYAEDENSIPVLFATQMHVMAQYMVDTLNAYAGEYDKYIKHKAECRLKMKAKNQKKG